MSASNRCRSFVAQGYGAQGRLVWVDGPGDKLVDFDIDGMWAAEHNTHMIGKVTKLYPRKSLAKQHFSKVNAWNQTPSTSMLVMNFEFA
eukprot:4782252-Pyramimonas_sp.AAC.1